MLNNCKNQIKWYRRTIQYRMFHILLYLLLVGSCSSAEISMIFHSHQSVHEKKHNDNCNCEKLTMTLYELSWIDLSCSCIIKFTSLKFQSNGLLRMHSKNAKYIVLALIISYHMIPFQHHSTRHEIGQWLNHKKI